MSLRYNSFKYSYPAGILLTGASPVDNRLVVMNIDLLTASNTWANSPAYQGLIVSVLESKEAYMFAPDSSTDWDATKPENWKKISAPDLDISGRMVTVIEYQGEKWAKEDGTVVEGQWQPNPGAEPLPGGLDLEVDATYLQLALNDDDYVYIKSTDLIDLTDYYTKEQVDDKLYDLDSSIKDYVDSEIEDVNIKIADLSTDIYNYVDEHIENVSDAIVNINSSISRIDTSVLKLFGIVDEFVDTVHDYFDITDSSIEIINGRLDGIDGVLDTLSSDIEEINEHLDNVDSSIKGLKGVDSSLEAAIEDISSRLAEIEVGTVDSISTEGDYIHVDTSKGDVTFTADVVDSNDQTSFPSRGLVTDGYVEERLDVFNWIEVEDTENPPVESGVQQSNAPIQTTMNLATDDNTLAVISTGGDVTIE